jgi:hypothetical protein
MRFEMPLVRGTQLARAVTSSTPAVYFFGLSCLSPLRGTVVDYNL